MLELCKSLRNKGFPQGGTGIFIQDPETGEKFYKPQPAEVYAQFILDPDGWDKVTEALIKVWVDTRK